MSTHPSSEIADQLILTIGKVTAKRGIHLGSALTGRDKEMPADLLVLYPPNPRAWEVYLCFHAASAEKINNMLENWPLELFELGLIRERLYILTESTQEPGEPRKHHLTLKGLLHRYTFLGPGACIPINFGLPALAQNFAARVARIARRMEKEGEPAKLKEPEVEAESLVKIFREYFPGVSPEGKVQAADPLPKPGVALDFEAADLPVCSFDTQQHAAGESPKLRVRNILTDPPKPAVKPLEDCIVEGTVKSTFTSEELLKEYYRNQEEHTRLTLEFLRKFGKI